MMKTLFTAFLILLMLLHPDLAAEGARSGLLLWYTAVVPSLFPFMVLSKLLVSGGGLHALMRPVSVLLSPFFRLSDEGFYVLVSGLFCGYPMGAKTCADFLREGRITESEGRFLMSVSCHPSPMFIMGYMFPFFKGKLPAAVLLLSIYGPVILIALLAKAVYRPKAKKTDAGYQKETASISMDEAILSAFEVLVKIGGCLMFFSIVIEFLSRMRMIPETVRVLITAALEMTTGIREAAGALPFPYSAAVSCAALTFGGFSGLFQTMAVIGNEKKAGLSTRQYFFWKCFHGACSAALVLIFLRFLSL